MMRARLRLLLTIARLGSSRASGWVIGWALGSITWSTAWLVYDLDRGAVGWVVVQGLLVVVNCCTLALHIANIYWRYRGHLQAEAHRAAMQAESTRPYPVHLQDRASWATQQAEFAAWQARIVAAEARANGRDEGEGDRCGPS